MTAQENTFYILDEDKRLAKRRIAELEKAIADMGPDFHTALNEADETWHDNAPFDALREKQAVYAAELNTLQTHLRQAALSVPHIKPGVIGVGSRVHVNDGGKERRYLLAGHWSARTGHTHDGYFVITCASPIGSALLGAKHGQSVTIVRPAKSLQILHIS